MSLKISVQKKLAELMRFFKFVMYHFVHDDCFYRASALAFTTLSAIVPLAGISLSVLSAFPPFHSLKDPMQNFIFEHFVPQTGKMIESYLEQFIEQLNHLSLLGMGFLFATALLSMFTIEQSMNKIWKVKKARHGLESFLLYWTILTLTPILLGFGITLGGSFLAIPSIQNSTFSMLLIEFLSFFIAWVGFTFIYLVVPNCKVKFIHALSGGFIASLLFEATKRGFQFYFHQYNFYELIYGAFAIIPLFFIWIYFVWFITLLCAEMTYALSHYKPSSEK